MATPGAAVRKNSLLKGLVLEGGDRPLPLDPRRMNRSLECTRFPAERQSQACRDDDHQASRNFATARLAVKDKEESANESAE